uniref:Core-binding factor subunit beta n=1 Tax=Panthera leo TaxID=9689 RepID=A0A8C8XG10_PANLE
MPRVVPDQRSKFENEEFFRKLSRECEIKYTGFRDRPHEERQARFQNACRDGRSEIVSRRGKGTGGSGRGDRGARGSLVARGPPRPRPVPDGAADAAAPGTERAPSHFLLGIQNEKQDTGGPRPRGETLPCGPLRVGYVSQARLDSLPRVELTPEPNCTRKAHCTGCDTDKGFGVFVRKKTPIRKKNKASFKDLIPGR